MLLNVVAKFPIPGLTNFFCKGPGKKIGTVLGTIALALLQLLNPVVVA